MRNKFINFRDTWDLTCAVTLVISVFFGLMVAVFSPMGQRGSSFVVTTCVMMLNSFGFLLIYHATIGWWVMRLIGYRVRINYLLSSWMAGMLIGLAMDVLLLLAAIVILWPTSFVPDSVKGWAMMGLLALIPMIFLSFSSVMGALRWRHLETKGVV